MALRRFFAQEKISQATPVVIRGDLFHHISEVCRFKTGDHFELLPGDGTAWLVEVLATSVSELSVRPVSQRQIPPLTKPYITLALSIPKLPKVDWIVEKAVELGIYELRPFVSDHSFLRKTAELSSNRVQRWQKLIDGATQQSGRGERMRLGPPSTLKELLVEFNQLPQAAGLFPYEGESELSLAEALSQIKLRDLDHLWVFVGSEGGFSAAEVQLFADRGLRPVTMGEQILRVETACLALASIIKYELGR